MYGYKTSTDSLSNKFDLVKECTRYRKKIQLEVDMENPRHECFTGRNLSENESIKQQHKR